MGLNPLFRPTVLVNGIAMVGYELSIVHSRPLERILMSIEQKTYIAIVLIASSSETLSYTPLYDETTLLIKANSLEEARERAMVYGKSREGNTKNAEGIDITMKFLGILDIKEVVEVLGSDVTAINSRSFNDFSAYESFTELIERKY
jgi:hypothetical protein